ncbi:hypothetical protein HO133_005627 [Letharia lupina]|uniref:Vitamin B6 transporter n=1 Tax=Letharia lupina TaxID=560253 RepID=A0A8H6C7U1_9LECA|nr:uncharacterized protein HO133_005627 [Letharia lupina]KAF6218281.1 hypothetical protein HO133_005627 [Letharia lupina]
MATEDVEKVAHDLAISRNNSLEKRTRSSESFVVSSVPVPHTLAQWNTRIESLAGLEARGIARVPPEERHEGSVMGYAQMTILWFSANVTANNLAVGLLGPLVFNLGFVDSAMMATFGSLLGSAATAYMSIWGAQSGNRTMILSAVSGGSMSIAVGIIITALVSWLVAVFGMAVFQTYERWAWIPQVIVLLVLAGIACEHFDTSSQSTGGSAAVTAGRLSFFSISLSAPVSWAGAGSDFYVYYPETTSKRLAFFMTLTGLWTSITLVYIIGIGLASGIAVTPSWSTAYDISSGALILEGYSAVGGFGKFCGVVVALGVIANNVPSTYAAALGCQVMGRYGKMVPRYLWVCAIVLVYFVCAIAGRDHLFVIFQNFLALMGYWVVIFVSIVLEEHLIFRRNRGFDWAAWENKEYLPIGAAALTAFLVGWAGAIIGMSQVWYIGPVAKLVGGIGADVGIWLGMGFALLTFPPLRYLELRTFGK